MVITTEMIKLLMEKSYTFVTLKQKLIEKFPEAHITNKEIKNRIALLLSKEIIRKTSKKDYRITKKYPIIEGRVISKKEGVFLQGKDSSMQLRIENPENIFFLDHVFAFQVSNESCRVQLLLEHHNMIIRGVYLDYHSHGDVIPQHKNYNAPIYIEKPLPFPVNSYDLVEVEILPTLKGSQLCGKICAIIREEENEVREDSVCLDNILDFHNRKRKHSNKAVRACKHMKLEINPKREDLTDEFIFTIDGDDSKDFDDAISLSRIDNGNYLLGVHIADVSHYVQPGTKVDEEAYQRSTSIYCVNEVIPMLPFSLSNGLCSLIPGEKRLTLSCFMEIDKEGTVLHSRISESVIQSKARLTYSELNRWLEGKNKSFKSKNPEIAKKIEEMLELSKVLENKRKMRGCIEFNFPDAQFISNGTQIVNIIPYLHGPSNQMIEEFMICCNESVANYAIQENIPFIYRTHQLPFKEKIDRFREVCKYMGIEVSEIQSSLDLQRILEENKGKTYYPALEIAALHIMMQARYTTENIGHFGLGSSAYTHFTSPIRRYPDLMIHRIIKEHLKKPLTKKRKDEILSDLEPLMVRHFSTEERVANRIEQEYQEVVKTQWLYENQERIFRGKVMEISETNLWIQLDNTIQGIIKMKYSEWNYDDEKKEGYYRNNRLALGDVVEVIVKKVKQNPIYVEFKLKEPSLEGSLFYHQLPLSKRISSMLQQE